MYAFSVLLLNFPSYPEIEDSSFRCALWTFKQQLTSKVRARCGISIVLLQTSLYCGFRDTKLSVNLNLHTVGLLNIVNARCLFKHCSGGSKLFGEGAPTHLPIIYQHFGGKVQENERNGIGTGGGAHP